MRICLSEFKQYQIIFNPASRNIENRRISVHREEYSSGKVSSYGGGGLMFLKSPGIRKSGGRIHLPSPLSTSVGLASSMVPEEILIIAK